MLSFESNVITYLILSTQAHCSDRRNRLFPATDPIDSFDFRSVPLNSDDFLTTGFRSSFCRKSSGKFRKISTRKFVGNRRNRWELIGTRPTKSGPESCSQEIVGIQWNRSVPMYPLGTGIILTNYNI